MPDITDAARLIALEKAVLLMASCLPDEEIEYVAGGLFHEAGKADRRLPSNDTADGVGFGPVMAAALDRLHDALMDLRRSAPRPRG
ncbi:hypothetical protein KPL78_19260 [Roseomonas sp. HJA6]|uniref:HD domain-containing protein n=1 Tax=Roseomonas alba TaxID=2846776 RepID=A0ABS7ACJ3_9PROT|nr:hypothetical protein [Neoroseomonas alba]MBW6400008.1 hypothetical protein [Neoroseomonas alba]